MILSRILSSSLCLVLLAGSASADSIKLKNGEILKGEILAETPDAITVEYEVSKGIKDEKKISRDEILAISKEDPADKAWAELTKDIPTADLLGLSDYDSLIDRTNTFLRAHGTSIKAGPARRLLESLREERNRVALGDMKLGGSWITVAQYQREKYWVDGKIALRSMLKAGQSGRYVEALRQFNTIEATYGGTSILANAIPEATTNLKRYAAAVNEATTNLPRLLEQRAKRLGTLSPSDRAATEQAQLDDAAAIKSKVEAERKAGLKWLTLDPYSADSLKEAAATIDKELARIAAINTEGAATREALLRQIEQAIHEGRFDSAADSISKSSKDLLDCPYLKTLEERVKSEVSRINAEKKAAEEARKDAEQRAAKATPKPMVPAAKSAEDEAIEQADSPIAKAVRESNLGKRVAEGQKSTPTQPAEPAAPTTVEPPATAAEPAVTPPAPAEEEVAASASTTTKPAKKSGGGNLTPILYGIAAVLALALLGLLVLPMLKKTPAAEEPAAPTDTAPAEQAPDPAAEASELKPEE